tara:strand:+ start:806 stop:1012 length:207 start_codon:yes stop_codon:yes gene_type:complete
MLKILKLFLKFLSSIKFKSACCYESQCSINDQQERIEDKNVNEYYNDLEKEIDEELKFEKYTIEDSKK